jgi:hypothetical protein
MQEIGFELFVTGVRVGLRITNSQKIKIEIIYIFAVLSMSQTYLARPVLPLCYFNFIMYLPPLCYSNELDCFRSRRRKLYVRCMVAAPAPA